MKRFFNTVLFALAFVFCSCNWGYAQQVSRLSGRCQSPYQNTYQSIEAVAQGNLVFTPCATKASVFTGGVDFSGATITGLFSGTQYAIPYFSNSTTLASSPFSWNGTQYAFNNTAGTSEFNSVLKPDTATGTFYVGDMTGTAQRYLAIGSPPASSDIQMYAQSNATTFAGFDAALSGYSNMYSSNGTFIATDNTIDLGTWSNISQWAVSFKPDKVATNAGWFKVGDYAATPTTYFILDQAGTSAELRAASIDIDNAGGLVSIGDTGLVGNGTRFTVDAGSHTFGFYDTSGAGYFDMGAVERYGFRRTITGGGTTGNQTINKPVGTVNFAAAATAITVSNNTVDADSLVLATAQTNDATCAVKNVVASANQFVINMTAGCTAETRVAFWVMN